MGGSYGCVGEAFRGARYVQQLLASHCAVLVLERDGEERFGPDQLRPAARPEGVLAAAWSHVLTAEAQSGRAIGLLIAYEECLAKQRKDLRAREGSFGSHPGVLFVT